MIIIYREIFFEYRKLTSIVTNFLFEQIPFHTFDHDFGRIKYFCDSKFEALL